MPAGGAESVVQSLMAAQAGAGQRVGVAAIINNNLPHPLSQALQAGGLTVHEVRLQHRRYLAEARAIEGIARAGKYDILHTHVYHGDFAGYLAARRCALPVVSTVHGYVG